MFIIIHNKLINKCYSGTFGKHSVFGNGDVSNRKPNLRNCRRLAPMATSSKQYKAIGEDLWKGRTEKIVRPPRSFAPRHS